jgi:hypothetical protein
LLYKNKASVEGGIDVSGKAVVGGIGGRSAEGDGGVMRFFGYEWKGAIVIGPEDPRNATRLGASKDASSRDGLDFVQKVKVLFHYGCVATDVRRRLRDKILVV